MSFGPRGPIDVQFFVGGERGRPRASFAGSVVLALLVGCANGTDVSSPSEVSNDGGALPGPGDGSVDGGNVLPEGDGGAISPDGGDTSEPDGGDTEEPAGCTDKIVINEVMPEGSTGEEFVELYNPNDCDVSVGKWKLLYRSKSNSVDQTAFTFSSSQKIGAKEFFVVGTSKIPGKDAAFALTSILGNAGGQIGLVDTGDKLVDAVGFGPATGDYVEGTSAALPGAGKSIARVPDGHDTDDNAADLVKLDTPTPGASNE